MYVCNTAYLGAGFYVDATEEKWAKHYKMYSYITHELPTVLEQVRIYIAK